MNFYEKDLLIEHKNLISFLSLHKIVKIFYLMENFLNVRIKLMCQMMLKRKRKEKKQMKQKQRKHWLSLVLILTLLFSLPLAPVKADASSDTQAITEVTNRFFSAKNDCYTDGTDMYSLNRLAILDFYNTRFAGLFSSHNYSIDFFLNRMAFFNESYRVRAKQIENYVYNFQIKSISIKNNTATVKVDEQVTYQESGKSASSGWNNSYTLTFINDNSWLIDRIYCGEGFYTRYYQYSDSVNVSSQLDSAFANLYQDNAGRGTYYGEIPQTAVNAELAVNYAQTYALNYNPNFPSYAGRGGDCANFGSQCIYVGLGGNPDNPNAKTEPMVDMGITGPRSWYHTSMKEDTGKNWSWTSTNRFYNHVISGSESNPGLYGIEIDVHTAQPGDIIQVDFQNNGEFDHTVFVSYVDNPGLSNSLSQILTCGHTNDRLNYPLDQFGYGANYRAIRILGNVQTIPGDWIETNSRWQYIHKDSGYSINAWEKIDGKWYHFDQDGFMQTGWLLDGPSWYYLDAEDGYMYTGMQIIDNASYTFDNSGAWISEGNILEGNQ